MLRWRYHDVIMAVVGEVDSKKYVLDREMNLSKANMKYGRLVVFIRHDSSKI